MAMSHHSAQVRLLPSFCHGRCVFMRLTSIGVLLFSLWSQITTCNDGTCICGYNHQSYSVSLV